MYIYFVVLFKKKIVITCIKSQAKWSLKHMKKKYIKSTGSLKALKPKGPHPYS